MHTFYDHSLVPSHAIAACSLSRESLARLADHCDEFLVHGVDVEGMKLGIDRELVELLGELSPIPVVSSGTIEMAHGHFAATGSKVGNV